MFESFKAQLAHERLFSYKVKIDANFGTIGLTLNLQRRSRTNNQKETRMGNLIPEDAATCF